MNYLKAILIASCLTFNYPGATAAAKGWRGIIPLRSNRDDVERLLGVAPKSALVKYDVRGGRVFVTYEMFPCDHTPPEGWPVPPPGWAVPKNTVIRVRVELEEPLPLDSLGADLGDFKREEWDSHHFNYTNDKEGFAIATVPSLSVGGESIVAYDYGPTAEDERLRCPARKTPEKTSP